MKQITLLLLWGAIGISASAQVHAPDEIILNEHMSCGFNKVLQKVKVDYSQLVEGYRMHAAVNRTERAPQGIVYDIPVVFHIVYAANQPTFNINDSIIKNQIDVLNKAYRKRHADTANTRSIFKSLSIDGEIQFHLAAKDPAGKVTSGITRTVSKRTYFGSTTADMDSLERVKKTATGGIDPWPTQKYLNIWVCNLTDSKGQLSVLGYAIPPLNPLPPNWPAGTEAELAGLIDGVVLQVHSVGSNSPLNAALQGIYTKGRCAVHEVGHYLGLQHIFGSTAGNSTADCGTALITDGMDDTPEQALISQIKGCPPADKNSCGAGTSGDLPDMWENYMDYSTDACQTLFTKDQIALMRSVLDDQRHTLFDVTSVDEITAAALSVYPNPATDAVTIIYSGKINKVTVFNYMGQAILEFAGKENTTQVYDTGSLPTGTYLFLVEPESKETITAKCTIIR